MRVAIALSGKSKREVARAMGYSESHLESVLAGCRGLDLDDEAKLARAVIPGMWNCTAHDLLGRGSPFRVDLWDRAAAPELEVACGPDRIVFTARVRNDDGDGFARIREHFGVSRLGQVYERSIAARACQVTFRRSGTDERRTGYKYVLDVRESDGHVLAGGHRDGDPGEGKSHASSGDDDPELMHVSFGRMRRRCASHRGCPRRCLRCLGSERLCSQCYALNWCEACEAATRDAAHLRVDISGKACASGLWLRLVRFLSPILAPDSVLVTSLHVALDVRAHRGEVRLFDVRSSRRAYHRKLAAYCGDPLGYDEQWGTHSSRWQVVLYEKSYLASGRSIFGVAWPIRQRVEYRGRRLRARPADLAQRFGSPWSRVGIAWMASDPKGTQRISALWTLLRVARHHPLRPCGCRVDRAVVRWKEARRLVAETSGAKCERDSGWISERVQARADGVDAFEMIAATMKAQRAKTPSVQQCVDVLAAFLREELRARAFDPSAQLSAVVATVARDFLAALALPETDR